MSVGNGVASVKHTYDPFNSSNMDKNQELIGQEMSESETMALLETKGHGVLSIAKDDRAYGIPVSFGYDESEGRFLFEFLNLGESKKQQFVSSSEEVTLTVYEYNDQQTWKSGIVTGTIHSIDAANLSERSVSSFALQAEDGAEEVRWAEADKLERQWYQLQPSAITGRCR
jgi:nitroimidazol reductase NimA-like FMN-containing flavoprotein (pyridoxamine 5'-phosphate oxidase superfamily)